MPRPSQGAKILEAALHCFATYGYDATRIKHIAEAAGVSEGALYRHYPSKEAVAQELFINHMRAYVNRLLAAITHASTVADQLHAIVEATLGCYHDDPDGVAFVLLGPPLFGVLPSDVPFPLTLVTEVIRRGQDEGTLRAGNPVLVAAIFLGCIVRPMIVARSALHADEQLLTAPEDAQIISEAAWAAVARSPVVRSV